ncbi:MAG: hypothetical protein GWO04_18425, partial [Actinobacteria bacterium]|nr:hypothetical protein [Actinomycetota bacterium]
KSTHTRLAAVLLAAALAGCEGDTLPGVRDLDGSRVDPIAGGGAPVTVTLFVDSDCPVSNRYAPEV